MKLGSIYYIITLLDSIEDFTGFIAPLSFLVLLISSFIYIVNKIELSERLKTVEVNPLLEKDKKSIDNEGGGSPRNIYLQSDPLEFYRGNNQDLETIISESRLWSKVSKPYIKWSLVLFVISTITTMIIPEKKDMLIVLSANYLDEKIISNDKAEDWAKEKLDLIDKRVNKFLKSENK